MLNLRMSTIYLGSSLDDFNKVRECLEQHKIKYKHKISNHNEAMIAPGHGCGRTLSGIKPQSNLFEILVSKNDFELANFYLKQSRPPV